MPSDNSLGFLTGLVFVAVFLAMVGSCGYLAKYMQGPLGPSVSYELSGNSRPLP